MEYLTVRSVAARQPSSIDTLIIYRNLLVAGFSAKGEEQSVLHEYWVQSVQIVLAFCILTLKEHLKFFEIILTFRTRIQKIVM
jgi:hypothetical protein